MAYDEIPCLFYPETAADVEVAFETAPDVEVAFQTQPTITKNHVVHVQIQLENLRSV